MDLDMSIPIPSVLFGLGGKCVLNWALVLLQKDHIWRSFVCVFSLSLATVDTVTTLALTFMYLQGDSAILGWRLTRYHVCLLVQILGYIYRAQHFSILVIATLEHVYVVLRRFRPKMWKPTWIFQLFLTFAIWVSSTFYVFKLSNVEPYLQDVAHFQISHCWILSSSVISELVIAMSCLCLFWILCLSVKYFIQLAKNQHLNYQITLKIQIRLKLMFFTKVARTFLDPWVLFLVFLLLHVVIPVEMPSHLALNCAWLCFLNSLLIAVALCALSPVTELAQGSVAVPPDSFCDWKSRFSLAASTRHKFMLREYPG